MKPSLTYHISRLLPAVVVAALFTTGCLTSDEPFFQGANVIHDPGLIGHYRGHASGLEGSWKIEPHAGGNAYLVTYTYAKNCSLKFIAGLFNAGTNRFLNLMTLPNKLDCQDGHRDLPSTMEVLQSLMWRPQHMVVKVVSYTNGPAFSIVSEQALIGVARGLAPEMFVLKYPNITVPKMIGDTAKQYAFLVEHGGNTNLFPAEPQLVRFAPPPEPEPVNFEIDPTDPRWIKLMDEFEAEHRQKLEERRRRQQEQ